MPINVGFLYPVLALVVWTLVMWLWMYATRIPAMQKAQINPDDARHPGTYVDKMPANVRSVADNYNHLHEQPVVFYALAIYSHLVGVADPLNVGLAWAYVILRVAHSIFQATVNFVPVRFVLFSLSSVVLIVMAVRNLLALMV